MPETQTPPIRPPLSVIIPANNEAGHIDACLASVLAQIGLEPGALEVIVAANGCTDDTAARALGHADAFAARGWTLTVLDLPEGGKPGALNAASEAAAHRDQVYLDADIVMDPPLLLQISAVLAVPQARYATGRLRIARAKSWVSRRYGETWARLPFMRPGSAPGAGLFAVNAAGRARWERFPAIIADDTFVRWHFAPDERVEVTAGYDWPLVEGFAALVRVRARQDAGGVELRRLYPGLEANEGKPGVGWRDQLSLARRGPVSFAAYLAVKLGVRLRGTTRTRWDRGRR